MKLAVLKEKREDEPRVAATPETVKRYIKLGASVTVEAGAGLRAAIPDSQFEEAGATIAADAKAAVAEAELVLKVRRPMARGEGADETALFKAGQSIIATLDALSAKDKLDALAKKDVTLYAMELMPRITRAQSMDVLSSQSNLAGYRAVIDGAAAFGRAFPMMMTAAGTVAPARVLILGAGVAGLQAIATARRLGAIVSAFDVRKATKEQVQSLGATFVEVEGAEDAETKGGYAKEQSEDDKKRQREKIIEVLKKTDIAITTALIPGKTAPILIDEEGVKAMKPGAIIVDMAAEQGGNCVHSKPGETVEVDGVQVLGPVNIAGRVAADASALYAKNLLNFITAFTKTEDGAQWAPDEEDDIIKGVTVARGGGIVHPMLTGEG